MALQILFRFLTSLKRNYLSKSGYGELICAPFVFGIQSFPQVYCFLFGIKLLMKVHFDTLLWNGVEWDYHTSERFKPRINPPFSTCLYLAGIWQLLSIRSISLNIWFCHLFWVKWQLFHDFAEQIKYVGSTKVVSPGESIDLKYLPENKNMLDRCKYDTYERLEKSCKGSFTWR